MAANKDGRLYVLDSASLGGADHKTPLHKSSQISSDTTTTPPALRHGRTRRERDGLSRPTIGSPSTPTRSSPMANGAITKGALVAFTVVDQNDAPTLQPQWVSRDLVAPVTPAVVNGVVFALASGEAKAHADVRRRLCCMRSTPRPARNSGPAARRSRASVRGVGPSAGDSQVYVATADGTLYTFGMPVER